MMPTFKIRASAGAKIAGGVNKPTTKQLETIAAYQAKDKLTATQQETLDALIAKRDAKPELLDGAKTYCEDWIKENVYGIKREFSSKYTEKGIECEPAAIELVADIMGYGLIAKNDEHFDGEYFTGTPDLILADTVEDIKNSWSPFTFPLFSSELPNKDYYYQLQIYMALTGKKKAAVNYCLIDAPEFIIDREARIVSLKAGFDETDMELYDMVKAKMTFTHLPTHLRHKRFEFDRDEACIDMLIGQVKQCREYIKKLTEQPITIYDKIGQSFIKLHDTIQTV